VLGLPIDHAYASVGVAIHARVGRFVGSDHRPLVVDVALTEEAADERRPPQGTARVALEHPRTPTLS
jgi:hypothetical protein